MKIKSFFFAFGSCIWISGNANALTAKASNFTPILKSLDSTETVCNVNKGTEVSIVGKFPINGWLPVIVQSGSCSGKGGYMSAELLMTEESQGARLSRSTPILNKPNETKYDCFAIQNTPIMLLSDEKNSLISKIRVLDGMCKGTIGWVFRESIQM